MNDLPARRMKLDRGDHTTEFSIPEGVTDAEAIAEVEAMERAVRRGYSQRVFRGYLDRGGLRVNVRWLATLPPWQAKAVLFAQRVSRLPHGPRKRASDALFWLKCRWLDVYWAARDRFSRKPNA